MEADNFFFAIDLPLEITEKQIKEFLDECKYIPNYLIIFRQGEDYQNRNKSR